MTREEAIRQIENRWSIMDYGESEALGEALDMAIEALELWDTICDFFESVKPMPLAEPEHSECEKETCIDWEDGARVKSVYVCPNCGEKMLTKESHKTINLKDGR